jgi:hypothetical protein
MKMQVAKLCFATAIFAVHAFHVSGFRVVPPINSWSRLPKVSSGQEGIHMSIDQGGGSFSKLFRTCRKKWESEQRARGVAESADAMTTLARDSCFTGEEVVPDCFDLVRVAASISLDDSGVQVISMTGSSPDYDIVNILAILSEVRRHFKIITFIILRRIRK